MLLVVCVVSLAATAEMKRKRANALVASLKRCAIPSRAALKTYVATHNLGGEPQAPRLTGPISMHPPKGPGTEPVWHCVWSEASGNLKPSQFFEMSWATDPSYVRRYPKAIPTSGPYNVHPRPIGPKPFGALWAINSDAGWWVGYPGFIVELFRDGPGSYFEAGILKQMNACMTSGC